MQRFGRAFLTVSAILTLLVNLLVILLYGRQFYACPDTNGSSRSLCNEAVNVAINYRPIILLNAIVIGTLLMLWLAVLYYRRHVSSVS